MLERAYLHLEPLNDMFLSKDIPVTSVPLKIGRKVSQKTSPEQDNGYFDAKVLSRTHAHLVLQNDQVMIQDVGSSNGTFINGTRLSEDGQQSNPCQLNSGDILEFGLDIKDESGQIVHKKVSCSVSISYGDTIVKKPKEESIDGLLQLVDVLLLIAG
ncbi:SMAD/FHA domain-containing protein [Gorgonomyces haynaldii]|nr:SMAD/FHA domain-containing protein [Gorgonomyces haynaldii]